MHNLTVAQVKNAKAGPKPWKLSDGGGLYLSIRPNGSKYWRYDYRVQKIRNTHSLGVYPEVSLKEAREKHLKARELIAQGVDPNTQGKPGTCAESATFKSVANDWFSKRINGKSKDHVARTRSAINRHLVPFLGNKPVSTITAPEVLNALQRIESRGTIDTAHRTRSTVKRIFDHAIALGHTATNPAAALTGALTPRKPQHNAAITDPDGVGELLRAIDCFTGTPVVYAALRFSPLVFQRPGEIRGMRWKEINWQEKRWEIPAERMKMGEPHVVPLSRQALEILREIEPMTCGSDFVFPSMRGNSRCLSENAIRVALRSLGYDKETMTAHGFRAMARTLLDEELHFRVDFIEHQLAHAVKDPNGRAYNRTKHLQARTDMMQAWADYLDLLKDPTCQSAQATNAA